jgi:hypothetical protein
MGRKPLADIAKKAQLRILLTEAELESLTAAAMAAGMPTATWARDLLLSAARAAVPVKKPTRKKAT